MNFFGGETYPEDLSFLNDLARKKRTSFSKYIAKKIYDNDCLRAFAKKQFFTYCNRYDLVVDDAFDEKILKRSFPIQHLTDEQMLSNAINRKNELILVTCTRFDFPHKGYLIGFLRAFESLLSRYGNIRLRIIGYGENEALVMNTVGEMADDVKNRIEFYGKVDPSRIFEIIKSCHLAFGLAGSASLCASAGIPTLIMRHNTFLCETYGFFHEVNSTLDDRPGSDYVPYIELIQNCTDDEYCEICKKEMYAYEQRSEYDPYYILKQNNKSSKSPFSQVDIVRNIWWSIYTAVMSRLKK